MCPRAISRTPPRTCATGSRSLCGPPDLWDVAANGLFFCAWLCTATGRYAEAATVWAAQDVHARRQGLVATSPGARIREEALRTIRQVLGPARVRAAEQRGAAMSLAAAAEYALLLTASVPPPAVAASPGLGRLSTRERELVTLVAQGRTDAQIAAELYISVRTVAFSPGPDPGQDQLPPPRRPDPPGPDRRPGLTLALGKGLKNIWPRRLWVI